MSIDKDLRSEILETKIAELSSIRKELNDLFDRQNETIKDLHEYWGGTVGDEAYERLTKYNVKNNTLSLASYDNRIKFLKDTIVNYSSMDTGTKSTIEGNSNIKA